jgi:hypothetical protein
MTASGTITLVNVDQMSKAQRCKLANWLKQQASDLLVDGAQYADKFTTHSQTFTVGE